jgi:flagellar biosynthesis protein FlhA
MQTGFLRKVLDGLRKVAGDQFAVASPVVLCGTPARFHLRRMLEPFVPRIIVLSPAEIPPVVSVQSMGVVQ